MDLNSDDEKVIRYAYMREAFCEGDGARIVFEYWKKTEKIPNVVRFLVSHTDGKCVPHDMNDLPTLFVAEDKLKEMCSYLSDVIGRRSDIDMDDVMKEKCTRIHKGLVDLGKIGGSSWNNIYTDLMNVIPKIIGYNDVRDGLNIDTNLEESETGLFLDNKVNLQIKKGKYFLVGE